MDNFAEYSKYYDLLYKDKDYDAEANYVAKLIRKYAPKAKSILELGSGTGKHARLLAEKGFKIHGVERSQEMVNIAQSFPTKDITYEVNDISSFSSSTKYDAAISLFHVISYLTDNENLLATFNTVASSLDTGGVFIFDVWYSPAVYDQRPETRIKRLGNDEIKIIRLAESVEFFRKNVVEVNYEVIIEDRKTNKTTTFREQHPMRHFSDPEISLLASATGFKVLQAEEFLSGATPAKNTWGVCFILEKK